MDGSRFDNLTRALATSRRGILKMLAAGLLSGAGGVLGAGAAAAQGCGAVRRRCAADTDCCSGVCDPDSGRCVCGDGAEECGGDCIPLDQYQTDIENCGGCRVRCRRAPVCQTPACIDGACGSVPDPDQIEQPCNPVHGVFGVCTADGSCACPSHRPTPCQHGCFDTTSDADNCGACDNRCPRTAHGTGVCADGSCGIACDDGYNLCGEQCCLDSRNCCAGQCCPPGQCCGNGGTCSVDACSPHCVIDELWFVAGAPNPNNECELCDPDRDQSDWSTAASGTTCGEPGQCCNLGLCQNCGCRIDGQTVDTGATNPGNPCEVCDPVRDPTAWSPLSDESCGDFQTCCSGTCCEVGECCNTAESCEPCRCVIEGQTYESGALNPSHDCEYCNPNTSTTKWTSVSDFTDCDVLTAGRVCCNGECCSPTECCTATGCQECGPICRIDGKDVPAKTVDPNDPCQLCDPDRLRVDWSEAPDKFVCGGDLDTQQICCRGLCCDPGECCDDGCKPCRCHIAGFNWDDGTRNPLNHCQVCDPSRNPNDWSPASNGSDCGLSDGRECCEGQCCPSGQCCNDIGECAACQCQINGQNVVDGGVNLANTCQICNAKKNRNDWTTLADGQDCGGPDDDRVCCGGNCCPQGQCCDGGACKDCGCEIDGKPIERGTPNPDKPCEVCDPTRARFKWSPVDNDTACGPNGDQHCCAGECCAADQCCILDACGTCLCQIDGTNYAENTPNPANVCETCDPRKDPFNWSPGPDRLSCGDGQVCCTGICCDAGLCCTLGLCQVCGCQIGGQQVGEFAINPDNECEWCDPVLDPFGWSPRSDESCGADGGQVCCSGLCCDIGMCCDLTGGCTPCPCEIDGATYPANTANPANDCQVCDPLRDREAWSVAADNATCGSHSDQVCCAGVCCDSGECCHTLDAACGAAPCNCTIGENEVAEGDRNPENECEHCDPTEDPTGWTPLIDDAPCGKNGDQVCCLGFCCASGDCCTLGLCGPCGCQINGKSYDEEAINPDNPCQVCDPVLDQFAWSPGVDNTACGSGQVCCTGICCPAGECCGLSGLCQPCTTGCTIGGVSVANGAGNPQNVCEVCDPSRSTTDWSPVPDNSACGENGDQVCCGGICCGPSMCCIEGQCDIEFCNDPCSLDPDSCTCVIDGKSYPNGTVNQDNACQYCLWEISPTSWTNVRDNSVCGANGEQYCCQGVCCGAGQCCKNDGSCATGGSTVCDGCDIDGRFYPIATTNPVNECEFCKPSVSTTSWTPNDNHVPCGDDGDQHCCNGTCCAVDLCCTALSIGGECAPCGCDIDGESYVAGQTNPANWCQHCDPAVSTTSWSIVEGQKFCAADSSRDCCNGTCCLEGTCCDVSGTCEPMAPDVSNCVNWQFP